MNVELIAHTKLVAGELHVESDTGHLTAVQDSKAVSLIAIRTCYSPNKPSEILDLEGSKYFGDAEKEANRLINMIFKSKHTSTLEHVNYTFAVEGVSRSLLAQLTRHRHMSFSVQSQRYVKFGSHDKSGGFDYVVPQTVLNGNDIAVGVYMDAMEYLQDTYDSLRAAGIPAEDARMVLPNGATCNMVLTCNLRTFLEFYEKRKEGSGAQWEIAELAEKMRSEIVNVEPWIENLFV